MDSLAASAAVEEEAYMSQSHVIAVDLAKSVFEIATSRQPGRVAGTRRLKRNELLTFFAQTSESVVVMESCGTSHYWARRIEELGHRVVLLPAHHVRPYVQRGKTDRADAKGLLEAFRNERIRPVPVKTRAQQVLTTLHRLRAGWLAERTARLNALRGFLREQGFFIAIGARHVLPNVWSVIEDADCDLPDALRPVLAEACQEIRDLERRIKMVEQQLQALAKQTPAVQSLLSLPGVGLLTATALPAFVGSVQRFPSGRHFASYLGLTPREHSSGLKRHLGRISKQGDAYLRMLLIHGARSALKAAKRSAQPDRLRSWAVKIEKERGHNKAAVALANKLARIAWAVWVRQTEYTSLPISA
jgi:transposase